MSLSANITLPNGVEVTYWVIESARLIAASKSGSISINGYLNQSAYGSGMTPVTSYISSITLDPTQTWSDVTLLQGVYLKMIATDPYFSGATYNADGV